MIYHLINPTDTKWPLICDVALAEYLDVTLNENGLVLPKGRTIQVHTSKERVFEFPELKADIGVLCWPGYFGNSVHFIGWFTKNRITDVITAENYISIEKLKEKVELHKGLS